MCGASRRLSKGICGMFLFVSLRPAGELYHQVAVTEFADFVRATKVIKYFFNFRSFSK